MSYVNYVSYISYESLKIISYFKDNENLFRLSFTWKISKFGGLYINQSNIYDGDFIAKIVSR